MLKNRPVLAAIGLALLTLLLAACGDVGGGPVPTQPADIPIVTDGGDVIAEGRLEPGSYAQLAFLAGGQVAEVLVKEGDAVQAGDVLARLENRESLKSQVAQAEQAVLEAEQALKALNDNVALEAAQAQQSAVQLQDELERAERRLKNIKNPDIQFFENELKKAQDALTTARRTPRSRRSAICRPR
jgi:multidrug efflux pump subunit AcrA (membrane-fusion protein)